MQCFQIIINTLNAYATTAIEISLSSEIGSFVINASNEAPSQVSLLFPQTIFQYQIFHQNFIGLNP